MIDDKKHTIVLQSCPFCGGEATLDTRRDEKKTRKSNLCKMFLLWSKDTNVFKSTGGHRCLELLC